MCNQIVRVFFVTLYRLCLSASVFLLTANLQYDVVDRAVLTWFQNARSRKISISGTMLREKAADISKVVDPDTKFLASDGWLNKFTARHSITFKTLSGEGAGVDLIAAKSWKADVENICGGYAPENIYNFDESGLFYKSTPKKSYMLTSEMAQGDKNSKLRLTVALMANFAGQKEPPIIIGNAARPRAFGRINIETAFNLFWRSNKKAWMTTILFTEFLKRFDRKMVLEGRKVLLFLDNATSHADIQLKNVRLVFFPPNMTSDVQPLDQGIIQCFKLLYRKQLMNHLVSNLDGNVFELPEELVKVTALDALGWIEQAWKDVSSETIQKCFKRCGFVAPINPTIQTLESTSAEPTASTSAESIEDILQPYANFGETISADDAMRFAQFDNSLSRH